MTDTTDIPQLDTVEGAIDALADAPLLEVYRTLLPFDDQMVTATAVKLALAGGGGSDVVIGEDAPTTDDTGHPQGTLWLNTDGPDLWINNGDAEDPDWVQIGALGDDILVSNSVAVEDEFGGASLSTNGEGSGGQVAANVAIIDGVVDGTTSYLVSIRRGAVTAGDPGGDSWGIKLHGQEYLIGLPAIDDGDVATSERVQWFDDTEDAPTLRFKERDSAGNLHTGRSAAYIDDGTAFAGITKPSVGTADAASILAALVTLGLVTDDT